LGIQNAPTVAEAERHGQNSAGKQEQEVLFKPLFQAGALFAGGHQNKPAPEFSHGNEAQKLDILGLTLDP
jgi:hypothetical protein